MPIIKKKNSALLGISSLAKGSNVFARMMQAKDLMFVHAISYVCEPCQKMGVQSEVCEHKRALLPDWITEENEFSKFLFGDDTDVNREELGVMSTSDKSCFRRDLVETFISRPRHALIEPVRYIYMAIDPCSGSDRPGHNLSDFAIASICDPYTTIIGGDIADIVTSDDYTVLINRHINKLRAIDVLSNATIVLDVEANNAMEAGNIQAIVKAHGNVLCMNDYAIRKLGTITSNSAKEEMANLTSVLLNAGDLRISSDFVTSHTNPQTVFQAIEQQFKDYQHLVVSRGTDKRNIHVFHGKGENKTKKDDLCLCIQRCIRTRHRFLYDAQFQGLR